MLNKDKINFDTDFLDQNAKEKPKEKPKSSDSKDPNWVFHNGSNGGENPASGEKESRGKLWLWAIGIVIAIGIISSLGSSGSTTSSTPTPNNLISGSGQTYRCSSYAYDKATSMEPSSLTQTQINSESNALDIRTNSLNVEGRRIDNMYVDEYDQYSIDSYNEVVAAYNQKRNRLKIDIDNWNAKNNAFNIQIDKYNNYLDANCTKQ
jgi:hypothetical protein